MALLTSEEILQNTHIDDAKRQKKKCIENSFLYFQLLTVFMMIYNIGEDVEEHSRLGISASSRYLMIYFYSICK